MKKIILILFIVIALSSYLTGAPGSTGAQFLQIPPDARGNSLAGASISDVSDLNGLYWNPAGIYGLDKDIIMFSYNKWIASMNFFYLAYGLPLGLITESDALGVGVTYMDGGSFISTDMDGNEGPAVSSYYMGATVGYSTKISIINTGVNIKMFQQSLFNDYTSTVFSFDLGGQMEMPGIKNLKGGLIVKNLGLAGSVDSESDSLPITIQVGSSYKFSEKAHSFIAMLSSDIMIDESPFVNVGGEYIFNNIIIGRVGYKIETGHNNLGLMKGLNVGMGGRYKNFGLDISWGSMGVLGNLIQTTVYYRLNLFSDDSTKKEIEQISKKVEEEKMKEKNPLMPPPEPAVEPVLQEEPVVTEETKEEIDYFTMPELGLENFEAAGSGKQIKAVNCKFERVVKPGEKYGRWTVYEKKQNILKIPVKIPENNKFIGFSFSVRSKSISGILIFAFEKTPDGIQKWLCPVKGIKSTLEEKKVSLEDFKPSGHYALEIESDNLVEMQMVIVPQMKVFKQKGSKIGYLAIDDIKFFNE